jgi:hypothetical protein
LGTLLNLLNKSDAKIGSVHRPKGLSPLERVWNEQGLRRRTERRLLRVDVHEYHGLDKKD